MTFHERVGRLARAAGFGKKPGTKARKKAFALFLLLLIAAAGETQEDHAAQDAAPQEESQVLTEGFWDWKTGTFHLTLSGPIPTGTPVAPVERFRSELRLKSLVPGRLTAELLTLQLDSSRRMGDLAARDPRLFTALTQMARGLAPDFSQVDEAYSRLTLRYSLHLPRDLYPLLDLPSEADEVEALLSWRPTRAYSGLVIYARGRLPLGGTGDALAAVPALFPRLLDQNQESVLDASRLKPEFMLRWGAAAYSDDLSEEAHRDRIGYDPLRVVAWGVYGRTPCDLILASADVDRLLASPENRELLAEGRVLILIDPPKIQGTQENSHETTEH